MPAVSLLLATLLFLAAVFYLNDVLYDSFQLVLTRLAPKRKLVWVVLPRGTPVGLRKGVHRAATDLNIEVHTYENAAGFEADLSRVFLPELTVWYGASRTDVPLVQELLRNGVAVVAVDPVHPISGTLSLRQDGTTGGDAYWASFRQGYWSVASVLVSLHDFIFFPADITKNDAR